MSCSVHHPGPKAAGQRGVSLIELMVAITIGLVISGAMLGIFVTAGRSNADLARSGQVNESGRFSLQIVANEVSRAGFWGGWVPAFDDLDSPAGASTAKAADYPAAFVPVGGTSSSPTATPAIPDPCKLYADWVDEYKRNLIGIPIQVYEVASPVPTPTVPVCGSIVVSPQPATDVLIVRGVEPCAAGSAGCTALNSGELFFQRSVCRTDPTYVLTAVTANLTRSNLNCAAGTAANPPSFRFVSTIFYVRSYAVNPGDGIPTLMMSQFGLSGNTLQHNAAQPIIPGVQGFRVDLGIDNLSKTGASVDQTVAVTWSDPSNLVTPSNRGDGVPDQWVRCTASTACTLAQLTNVVALRLNVLVRSESQARGITDTKTYTLGTAGSLTPFNDAFVRRVYTQTVRVHNVSMRRETPPS